MKKVAEICYGTYFHCIAMVLLQSSIFLRHMCVYNCSYQTPVYSEVRKLPLLLTFYQNFILLCDFQNTSFLEQNAYECTETENAQNLCIPEAHHLIKEFQHIMLDWLFHNILLKT